jgi:hypothetical protein
MVPVQSEHRVPETALRFNVRIAGEGVVYPATPTQLLERGEDGHLIASGLAKALDDQLADPQFSPLGIPGWFRPV